MIRATAYVQYTSINPNAPVTSYTVGFDGSVTTGSTAVQILGVTTTIPLTSSFSDADKAVRQAFVDQVLASTGQVIERSDIYIPFSPLNSTL